MIYPLSDDRILRTRSEALKYLRAFQRHLKKEAGVFQEKVLAIEGDLREPVAYMCEALAQDYAHFWGENLEPQPGGHGVGVEIVNIDVDGEMQDGLERMFGEEKIEEAAHWILGSLQGSSCIFVGWALGKITIDGEDTTAYEERVCFHLTERKFIWVASHPDPFAPGCRRWDAGKKSSRF